MTATFCGECGQRVSGTLPGVGELTRDAIRALVDLDYGVLLSLGDLLRHPGRMTAEYVAGRRIRYVSPARLYVAGSLVFGLALLVADNFFVVSRGDEPRPESRAMWIRSWLWSVVVMMPAFAGGLRVLFPVQRSFSAHLIFSAHFHTFAFLLGAVALLLLQLTFPGLAALVVAVIAIATLAGYLVRALRRVYRCSRAAAVVKGTALLTAYAALQAAALWALAVIQLAALPSSGGAT